MVAKYGFYIREGMQTNGKWEDNIRMYLNEIGVNMRNWVVSAQGKNYWRVLVILILPKMLS